MSPLFLYYGEPRVGRAAPFLSPHPDPHPPLLSSFDISLVGVAQASGPAVIGQGAQRAAPPAPTAPFLLCSFLPSPAAPSSPIAYTLQQLAFPATYAFQLRTGWS